MSENGIEPIGELTILWITAGLGCDGESVALTAATQPSIEDIVMGGMPGIPRLRLLKPFYSYENAHEYIRYLELGAEGSLDPFILVIEGSIPDEQQGCGLLGRARGPARYNTISGDCPRSPSGRHKYKWQKNRKIKKSVRARKAKPSY